VIKTNIEQLNEFGQSVWLDCISRSLIDTGKLKSLIAQGVRGLTSNPTIFDKAISKSNDYDQYIKALKEKRKSTFEIYDDVTVRDIQDAADTFGEIYEATHGNDGYVSLEINPMLAQDREKTVAEGKRLYAKVKRANVMFKVPSTDAGFSAVTALLAEGINVNVTLIFSLQQYVKTADAYLKGVGKLLERGGNASRVRSVASVFVSRVDTLTDDLIDAKLPTLSDDAQKVQLAKLKGTAATANAALIYSKYLEIFSGEMYNNLQRQGGSIQRLLWGSTSTKNPAYDDIKYITELIGKNTVNTVPEKTLEAFLDHGRIAEALPGDIRQAQDIIEGLGRFGIYIEDVCNKLLEDGVVAFQESFASLLKAIEEKAAKLGK